MSFPLRNLALVTALTLVLTAGAGINGVEAAPRGGGWFGIDRQDPERMQERQQERFEKMCEYLELDETQKTRAKKLFESGREEMRAMFQEVREQELDREQVRDKMRQSFEQYRKEFESFLTEEQLGKLKLWEEQRGERSGRRMRPGDEPGPVELDLSDSQREQFDKLRRDHQDNLRGIRDKIKAESLERGQAGELLKAERERFRESLAGVLSEEQIQQLDRMHRRRPGNEPGPGMGPGKFGAPGGPGFGPGQGWFGGPGPAMGPGGGPGFEPMGGVLMGLRHRLNLSDEQVEQFHKLAGSAMDEFFDKFAAALDLEQQEKLKEMRAKIKERREMRHDGPPGE